MGIKIISSYVELLAYGPSTCLGCGGDRGRALDRGGGGMAATKRWRCWGQILTITGGVQWLK